MSQRISLTRIVALNWYGFRQIFDVDDNVLISGAFGTGKSALLDLVQYLLLGDHWRANRAAAGSGAYRGTGERTSRGRDLVGYCLGDTNQLRNGQRHFLRQSGVTLVALEFTRPADPAGKQGQHETWGIRLEFSSPDAAPKHAYFLIPDRLDYASIAPDNNLLSEDAFRTWIRREYGNEYLFARQRDYLEEMAAPRHLNFDVIAFQRTFPKAIAFEPEENVEKFIRDFILEESPLDVRDVRIALRAYDDTRKRLEKQEDEAGFLRRIRDLHAAYETAHREEAILLHVGHSLKLQQAEERRERHSAELKRIESEHADDLKSLEKARADGAEIEKLLGDVRFEIQKDPSQVEFDKLHRQKRELQEKVNSLQDAQKSLRQRLDDLHYRWMSWLKHGGALPLEGLKQSLLIDDSLLSRLRSGTDAERLGAMQKLADQFNKIWRDVEDLLRPLKDEIKTAKDRLQQLAEDLENLNKGQSPGSFPLFQALREKLGNRVEQLGRLIEVKAEAERWWPALELFLGRNRWALVVNNIEDYREALNILRKTPPGREPESLLNPAEARQLQGRSNENTLFSKVDVTHPVARCYVQNLLGDVLCVETVEELELCESYRAITPEGIFKQAPLRRRLRPAISVELTLGKEGMERMRATKLREQNQTRIQHEAFRQRLSDVQVWLDNGKKAGLEDRSLPDLASELPLLPQLEAGLSRTRSTIELLMTPEREARQKRLNDLESEYRTTLSNVAVLNDRKQNFDLTARPERDGLARAEQDATDAQLEVTASRVELSRRFSGILDNELTARREEFRKNIPRWIDCFESVQSQARKAGEQAVESRGQRKNERERLATVRDEHGHLYHPEYQNEFPVDDDGNEAWAARLRDLEIVELAKSRQLAADRKSEWERRLEDSVLNELNRRITEAQNTIRLLDRYLSQPIGQYRYRISQKKDTAGFSAIWQLLSSGLEITDPLMGSEVEHAKRELMDAVNSENKDDRALRLLDYRNYHHYDIEMVPADKPDAPPISMGRSGRNLSGGENQAPFFISMLAAFRRVYDRGDRGSTRSQQLGIVVMDEAFSKLSGDGIEDCLALARSFQLQLVMAFPPERLGVMVPHAQTVVMCQKEIERDADGYVTRITTTPLLTTMAEAMDALS